MIVDSNPGRYKLKFIFSKKSSYRIGGPPNVLLSWYWGSFPGVKRSGRKLDHTYPSSPETENKHNSTSSHPTQHHGVYVIHDF